MGGFRGGMSATLHQAYYWKRSSIHVVILLKLYM